MDTKNEIFVKEDPSEEIEFDEPDDHACEQISELDEIQKEESWNSNDDTKTKIEIKEESIGIYFEDAKNPESLKQISGITEGKNLIEECPSKNSDASERVRIGRPGFRRENKGTENFDRKGLSCSYCYFIFESEEELMSHLESCDGKVNCSRCTSFCTCESNLKFQMFKLGNTDDSTSKSIFKCSVCNYQSKHRANLKTHMVKHQSIKSFKCSECNCEVKHKGNLKKNKKQMTLIKNVKRRMASTKSKASEKRAAPYQGAGEDESLSSDLTVEIDQGEFERHKNRKLEEISSHEKLNIIYEELLVTIPARFEKFKSIIDDGFNQILTKFATHEDRVTQLETSDEKLNIIYEELLVTIPARFEELKSMIDDGFNQILTKFATHEDRITQLETRIRTMDVTASRTRVGIDASLPGPSSFRPNDPPPKNIYFSLEEEDQPDQEMSKSFNLQDFLSRDD